MKKNLFLAVKNIIAFGLVVISLTTFAANTDIQIVAKNLNIPWDIAFLPQGEMLITERPDNLIIFSPKKIVIKIPEVIHRVTAEELCS